ncbi:MAG: DUF5711 family protein [Patescibacteria group bacterium]|nr:DUF5711 family protein [Patescibacteria group bacterium]
MPDNWCKGNAAVKFKGTIVKHSSTTTFYNYKIKIDEILVDPAGILNPGDEVWVWAPADAQVDFLSIDDQVEVYGTYDGEPHREVKLETAEHYLRASNNEHMSLLWRSETHDWVSVDISSDGNYVAAGSSDSNLYLFDKVGKQKWNEALGDRVNHVAISDDGNYVAAGSGYYVYYFDRNENLLWKRETGDMVSSISVSNEGDYVAFTSWDGYVYYFDKSGFLWRYKTKNPPSSVSLSGDGEKIAVLCYEWVYYFNKNGLVWDYEIDSISLGRHEISISNDGQYVAAASCSGAYYFDKNKNLLWSFKPDACGNSVKISSDGEYVVLGAGSWGGGYGWVYYFSKASNKPIWEERTTNCVATVDISSNGDFVIAGSIPTLTLYYFNNQGELLFDYPIFVDSARISSNGKYIVAAGDCVYFFGPATDDSGGDGTDDSDGDGIPDDIDNCPDTPNPGKEDTDGDDVGDVCDNCKNTPNPDQKDTDKDGLGDACEPNLIITGIYPNENDKKIYYTIKNIGGITAGPSHSYLYIDDRNSRIASDPVSYLGVNKERDLYFDYSYTCYGDSDTIKVCADGKGRINEADDTDNCKMIIKECGSDPESLIVDIVNPEDDFSVVQSVSEIVKVKVTDNFGNTMPGSSISLVRATFTNGDNDLQLFDDGAHSDGAANDGIYANAWVPTTVATGYTETACTIKVTAHHATLSSGYGEVSGAINSPEGEKADIQVAELIIQPDPPLLGKEVTITTVVSNNGDLRGTINFQLYIDGILIKAEDVTLNPSESKDFATKWKFMEDGNHKIVANPGGLSNDITVAVVKLYETEKTRVTIANFGESFYDPHQRFKDKAVSTLLTEAITSFVSPPMSLVSKAITILDWVIEVAVPPTFEIYVQKQYLDREDEFLRAQDCLIGTRKTSEPLVVMIVYEGGKKSPQGEIFNFRLHYETSLDSESPPYDLLDFDINCPSTYYNDGFFVICLDGTINEEGIWTWYITHNEETHGFTVEVAD